MTKTLKTLKFLAGCATLVYVAVGPWWVIAPWAAWLTVYAINDVVAPLREPGGPA